MMLTQQQHNAVRFVKDYRANQGHVPTLEEIAIGIGVRSMGAVHQLVEALVDKGFLIRESYGWRGLRVIGGESAHALPLVDRIATGQTIEAIPGQDTLNFADILLGPNRNALRVVGDSMVGAC